MNVFDIIMPVNDLDTINFDQIGVCNSYLIVNLGIIFNNINKVKSHIGKKIKLMPIIKSNAYGLGLYEITKFLTDNCGIKIIGCATASEALQLKNSGIPCEFLILSGVPFNNIPAVVEHGFITPAYNGDYLNRLNSEAALQRKRAKVEIKIETGLNRIGVLPGDDLDKLLELIKNLKNIELTGAYTHFAESEIIDKSFTLHQFDVFLGALSQIKAKGFKLQRVHAFNTAAIIWLNHPEITHVRPASLLFGFDVSESIKNALNLAESLTWRTFVTNVKTVPAGETVGYNRVFLAEKPTQVVTVSAGYGDGYPPLLSKRAEMLINGKRAKVISVCMDQILLDATGIQVKIDDTVTMLGRDGDEFISAFEIQKLTGVTYRAFTTGISERVKRIYIGY